MKITNTEKVKSRAKAQKKEEVKKDVFVGNAKSKIEITLKESQIKRSATPTKNLFQKKGQQNSTFSQSVNSVEKKPISLCNPELDVVMLRLRPSSTSVKKNEAQKPTIEENNSNNKTLSTNETRKGKPFANAYTEELNISFNLEKMNRNLRKNAEYEHQEDKLRNKSSGTNKRKIYDSKPEEKRMTDSQKDYYSNETLAKNGSDKKNDQKKRKTEEPQYNDYGFLTAPGPSVPSNNIPENKNRSQAEQKPGNPPKNQSTAPRSPTPDSLPEKIASDSNKFSENENFFKDVKIENGHVDHPQLANKMETVHEENIECDNFPLQAADSKIEDPTENFFLNLNIGDDIYKITVSSNFHDQISQEDSRNIASKNKQAAE